MAKKILIVDPNGEGMDLIQVCREIEVMPIVLTRPRYAFLYAVRTVQHEDFTADEIIKSVQRYNADGIWPASPDCWEAAMSAAETLRLPHMKVENNDFLLLDLKHALEEQGTRLAECRVVDGVDAARNAALRMGMPLWVRSMGSMPDARCMRVEHEEDLALALSKVAQVGQRHVYLEQLIEGPVYRVLGFREQRAFHPVEIIEERGFEGPYRVSDSMIIPAPLDGYASTRILNVARQAGAVLPTGFGPAEVEIVLQDGEPVVTELRLCAGMDPVLAEAAQQALGLELQADSMRLALGASPEMAPSRGVAAAVCWVKSSPGVVTAVDGEEAARKLPGVQRVVVQAKKGDALSHVVDRASQKQVGYVLGIGPTSEMALERAEAARAAITVETRAALE